jgi:hypothetical protein
MRVPRTTKEIIEHADELAQRFMDMDPNGMRDASALAAVSRAVIARAEAEQAVIDAVHEARKDGHSWRLISVWLGTSGEAARQKYGEPQTADRTRPASGRKV